MNKIKSQLDEIIDNPFSTDTQIIKAKALLDSMKPSAPVAPSGNVALSGFYKTYEGVRVLEIVNFTVVVSPEYFTALQKQRGPCPNGLYSNEFANHANDQFRRAWIDIFLEKSDPEKQKALIAPARAKFPETDFDKYIQKPAA